MKGISGFEKILFSVKSVKSNHFSKMLPQLYLCQVPTYTAGVVVLMKIPAWYMSSEFQLTPCRNEARLIVEKAIGVTGGRGAENILGSLYGYRANSERENDGKTGCRH